MLDMLAAPRGAARLRTGLGQRWARGGGGGSGFRPRDSRAGPRLRPGAPGERRLTAASPGGGGRVWVHWGVPHTGLPCRGWEGVGALG